MHVHASVWLVPGPIMHDTGGKDETPPQYRFLMHVTDRRFALFALNATAELGSALAAALEHPLAPHEEREFEDGEHKTRPLEAVRGADVFFAAKPPRRTGAERQ